MEYFRREEDLMDEGDGFLEVISKVSEMIDYGGPAMLTQIDAASDLEEPRQTDELINILSSGDQKFADAIYDNWPEVRIYLAEWRGIIWREREGKFSDLQKWHGPHGWILRVQWDNIAKSAVYYWQTDFEDRLEVGLSERECFLRDSAEHMHQLLAKIVKFTGYSEDNLVIFSKLRQRSESDYKWIDAMHKLSTRRSGNIPSWDPAYCSDDGSDGVLEGLQESHIDDRDATSEYDDAGFQMNSKGSASKGRAVTRDPIGQFFSDIAYRLGLDWPWIGWQSQV